NQLLGYRLEVRRPGRVGGRDDLQISGVGWFAGPGGRIRLHDAEAAEKTRLRAGNEFRRQQTWHHEVAFVDEPLLLRVRQGNQPRPPFSPAGPWHRTGPAISPLLRCSWGACSRSSRQPPSGYRRPKRVWSQPVR